MKVDQANVEATRLTLGYTDIYAPISGRAGRILVQQGNLVKANDTQALLVINQISPIFVNFAVPGKFVDRVRSAQAQAILDVHVSSDDMPASESGKLALVDNAVDPATIRSDCVPALPMKRSGCGLGSSVNIALTLGNDTDAIVVPDAAVKAGPNGTYVFVVKPDNRVEQRVVSVTRSVEGESVIEKGIAAGENIVIDGQSRLIDGSKVKVSVVASSIPATAAASVSQ